MTLSPISGLDVSRETCLSPTNEFTTQIRINGDLLIDPDPSELASTCPTRQGEREIGMGNIIRPQPNVLVVILSITQGHLCDKCYISCR